MERGQKWVLLGLLVGFYGNWYFNLLSKLEFTDEYWVFIVTTFSAISLFLYCVEITSSEKTFKIGLPLSQWFAVIHLFTTYFTMVYLEGWVPPNPISMIGILLWIVIIMYGLRARH